MDARARWRDDARVPLDLTDLELETAARACRALAYQEGEAAKRLENPRDARADRGHRPARRGAGGSGANASVRGRIAMEEGARTSSLLNACAPIQAFRPTKRALE
jgi:hypothetical protein